QTVRVSTDPRITTAVVLNSGMLVDGDQYMVRHGLQRSVLRQMHAPIAYFIGGESDIAWANAEDDWKELQALRLPALNANMDVGHGATYHLPNGGAFASGPLAWLKWQLKSDPAARAMFVGERCGFCAGDTWQLRRHRLDQNARQGGIMGTLERATRRAALLATTLAFATCCGNLFAQEPGMRAPGAGAAPAIVSPAVADGRVTFRLRAPSASTVTVSGDFGPDVALERDGDGVWSATVGPLKPDAYVYFFNVDGVRLPDPANPQVKIGYVTSTTTSLVTVPGDAPAFFEVQDVPHGEIRTLLYKSKSNDAVRELNVYLPPGYDANPRRRYPVLYLRHGFANDHHSWHRYGRANDILDNLLARKAIEPFIVVMPLGYGGAAVNGDGTGIPPA